MEQEKRHSGRVLTLVIELDGTQAKQEKTLKEIVNSLSANVKAVVARDTGYDIPLQDTVTEETAGRISLVVKDQAQLSEFLIANMRSERFNRGRGKVWVPVVVGDV